MILGEKLEITKREEKLKLLIDGEVFTDEDGNKIYLEDLEFCHDGDLDLKLEEDIVSSDWYSVVCTYWINGKELVDERVRAGLLTNNFERQVFMSQLDTEDMFLEVGMLSDIPLERIRFLVKRDILHYTKEAAVAHIQAMYGEEVYL